MAGGALLLIGPMGCGKSSVGRALAARLGLRFVDTDAQIEASSGMSIARIFELEGETGFRERETRALRDLSGLPEVVALGGGAVVSERNREILGGLGRLVWLDASPRELAQRVGDASDRPLLAGLSRSERVERLRQLREARIAAYASAELRIDTEGRSVEQVCDAIVAELGLEVSA